MIDMLLSSCAILLVFYLVKCYFHQKSYKLPPGPWGLPLLGYAPFITKNPYEDFTRLHKKYGPIFGIQIGKHYTVVLGSYATIKEAFTKDEFNYRPPGTFKMSDNFQHIGDMNGLAWKETRKSAMVSLKYMGKGRNNIEEKIREEISIDLGRLSKLKPGEEVNLEQFFSRSLTKIILSMIFGKPVHNENEYLEMFTRFFSTLNRNIDVTNQDFYFSNLGALTKLKKFAEDLSFRTCLKEMETFMWKEIETRERCTEPDPLENYLDHYIQEIKKNSGKNTSFTRWNMLGNALVLVFAGLDTVLAKLTWVMLFLAKYQKEQDEIYREIIEHVGANHQLCWTDKGVLPYAYAFLMEVSRMRSTSPAIDDHWSEYPGTIAGYDIPPQSVLYANMYAVHSDETHWGDPENFRPGRFLSEDGRKVVQPDYWIPFLIGRRSCPAEKLAMMQLFIITTTIVQQYVVSPPESGLDISPRDGSSLRAFKPVVSFRRRS